MHTLGHENCIKVVAWSIFCFSYIETPSKATKTTRTTPVTVTPTSTHVTSVLAKAPSTKPVNSKTVTASPPTHERDPPAMVKTPGKPQTHVAGMPN